MIRTVQNLILPLLLVASRLLAVDSFAATSQEIRDSIGAAVDARGLKYYELDIIARQGSVMLYGNVASELDRQAVEEISIRTSGVKSVNNYLQIKESPKTSKIPTRIAPLQVPPTDQEVAEGVRRAIKASIGIDLKTVDIVVQNGVVTFNGSLNSHREIDYVLTIALMVPGVTDIRSRLLIGGRPYTE